MILVLGIWVFTFMLSLNKIHMDSQDLMAEAQSFSAESPLKLANQAMKDSLAAASASAPDNILAQNEQVE